ncbi:MAG: hypothetical protein HUU02_13075, partial [Bacteroidetes bacterium]|nr:hypothetical protein [Bacteroidota bacterium]
MRSIIVLLTCLLLVSEMQAQIRTLRVEQLPVPSVEQWNAPLFSPSGTELFLTNVAHDGIWQYSLRTGLLKKLTSDRGAGFDPRLSENGSTITYRTTVVPGDHRTRVQESVSLSVTTGKKTILHRANSVELPLFIRNTVMVPERP